MTTTEILALINSNNELRAALRALLECFPTNGQYSVPKANVLESVRATLVKAGG